MALSVQPVFQPVYHPQAFGFSGAAGGLDVAVLVAVAVTAGFPECMPINGAIGNDMLLVEPCSSLWISLLLMAACENRIPWPQR